MAFEDRPNSSLSDSSIYIHLLIILETEVPQQYTQYNDVIRLIM